MRFGKGLILCAAVRLSGGQGVKAGRDRRAGHGSARRGTDRQLIPL